MLILKNVIFILTLIYAGYMDFKKGIIPDKVHVIIIVASFLEEFNLLKSIVGLLLLSIPFIVPIIFNEDSVGGGDIKIVGAIGFFLGLTKGTIAIVVGLAIAIVFSLFIFKKEKFELFPLAPYLAIGCIVSLLI